LGELDSPMLRADEDYLRRTGRDIEQGSRS
jgi:hypothetical protein